MRHAIQQGRLELVQRLAVEHASAGLLFAAEKGLDEIVRLLLSNNVNVDSKDDDGNTPLSWAAMKGHFNVVDTLLQHKANVNSANNYQVCSALTFVSQQQHNSQKPV